MNRNIFSLIPFVSGLLLASSQGHCDTGLEPRIDRLETDMKKVRGQTALGNYGAKTASASPQIDGYGFFITADFLWWKLYEGGTNVAFKRKGNIDVTPINGPILSHNFDWEPGFKVGLGYLFEHDGWDLYSNFTYYKTDSHRSDSSDFLRFNPLVGVGKKAAFKFDARWNVDFYDVDLVLGRNYFVSKYLSLHPFFGLSSAWIDQHQKFTALDNQGDMIVLKSKNDFWGIGPRVGLDAQFFFCQNYSLYGAIAGNLLWGDFHVKEKEDDLTLGTEFYNERSNLHRMVPNIGFNLGAAYETNFNKNHNHFMVKVGYESQYWWRQNQLPTDVINGFSFQRESQDLSLHGLTVEFRFDF